MEFILALIIISLLIKSYYENQEYAAERERLLKAVMAKNLQDYDASTTIKEPAPPPPPTDIPMEEADESVFKKHIQSIIDGPSKDGEYTE